MKNLIREVNFNDLSEWQTKKATPALDAFESEIYKIAKWEEFLKLFYYFAYKNPKVAVADVNLLLFGFDGTLFHFLNDCLY